MAMLFPILAVLAVAVYAGGLGVLFMVVDARVLEEWSVVIIGLAIVIGVPTVAALLQSRLERE
jgi:hypothetical protein